MNKIMQNMMKPIPVNTDSSAELRRAQEEHVLNWLATVDKSVSGLTLRHECKGIPGIEYDRYGNMNLYYAKDCYKILQRLERKGHVISALVGSRRYYSIPVDNGGDN